MEYKFLNLDNELKSIQYEIKHNNSKLVKDKTIGNIIYLKNNNIKSPFNKNGEFVFDISDCSFLTSKDFYTSSVLEVDDDYECILLSKDNISKEDSISFFLEQLEIYYLIFRLPNFNIELKKLEEFLNVFYDYVIENNKGNFLDLISQINRLVLANALIKNKEIRYIDYIDKLKYLIFFNFAKEDIDEIKNRLNYKKVIDFQKCIQKKI